MHLLCSSWRARVKGGKRRKALKGPCAAQMNGCSPAGRIKLQRGVHSCLKQRFEGANGAIATPGEPCGNARGGWPGWAAGGEARGVVSHAACMIEDRQA